MPRKKNPNNNYFHEGVEQAILDYNKADSSVERDKIFTIIYPALCKIAEVMYNKIKPTYADGDGLEIQNDCVVFMLSKLDKIVEGKGKAFSYMTVTARNYYIQLNMKAYKDVKKTISFKDLSENFDIEDVPSNRPEQIELNCTIYEKFLMYLEEHFDKIFLTRHKKIFGRALLNKLNSFDLLEKDVNRRKILNELFEDTGVNRNNITKYINLVSGHYTTFKEAYLRDGSVNYFIDKTKLTADDKRYIDENYQAYSKHKGNNGLGRILGVNTSVITEYIKQYHTSPHSAQMQ
jgi:hypothetical protein